MKHSLSTTPQTIIDSKSYERLVYVSAGNFSTAVAIYFQYPGSKNVAFILSSNAASRQAIVIPPGRRLEAYTDSGTADLAVTVEASVSHLVEET